MELSRNTKYIFIILVAAGTVGAALMITESDFLNQDHDKQQNLADKTVNIGSSVMPYRTEVNKTSVVEFSNVRNNSVSVEFETYQIEKTLNIPAHGEKLLNLSEYENLPVRNYFDAGGRGGQLVVE